MSDADWDNPGADNWIDAKDAWYVLGSKLSGGMGAPEAVPFSTEEKATLFANKQGGSVYTLATMPDDYFQSP